MSQYGTGKTESPGQLKSSGLTWVITNNDTPLSMTDQHTELWLTLISLFPNEELIRFHKRAALLKPEGPERYNLLQALLGQKNAV